MAATANAPTRDPARIREIDALRGIAALMVVLFHYTVTYDGQYQHHPGFQFSFELGSTGVELFFLISGFVILMTADRVRSGDDFAVARASRLYPAYWVCVLLTAGAITLIGLPGHEVTWHQVLVNLTMLQTFVGVSNVDGVYWTMAVELAFYGWVMLALRFGLTRRVELSILIWLFVVVAATSALAIAGVERTWAISTALLLYHGHLFAAGMLFYRLTQQPSRRVLWLLAATYPIEVAMRPETALIVGCWYLVIALVLMGRLRLLRWSPLLWLGAISYPFYLLHENIGFIVIRQLYDWQVESSVVLLAIPIAVSVALAAAVHAFVEVPAQSGIRRWFRRRRETIDATRSAAPSRAELPTSVLTPVPAYNAGDVLDPRLIAQEARLWRQTRPQTPTEVRSPVPVTTSRT